MAESDTPRRVADDGFEAYFREKLWQMIPAIYRHEDGLAEPPGVLRALVEVLAGQAAVVRRDADRLWEDQFIELCDDWAVPYLGDLLGTRQLSALNRRGRRADVAKTLYYKRRSGTRAVLEELIRDITGWDGTVVEGFQRLLRHPHRLDPPLDPESRGVGGHGWFTGTPPGGLPDLRRTRGAELAGGAFNEYFHTPDVRRHRGTLGRHNISKLAFHLYRLRAYEVERVTPWAGDGDDPWTFDPSGRCIPLFMAARGPVDVECRQVREWELPVPMRCRVLADEDARETLVPDVVSVRLIDPEVEAWPAVVTAGSLAPGSPPPAGVRLMIDPERGRFHLRRPGNQDRDVQVDYHYGFPGEIGAGPYARPEVEECQPRDPKYHHADGGPILFGRIDREGVTQIDDSATYSPIHNRGQLQSMVMQAANNQRPYLLLANDWKLTAHPDGEAEVLLDGLWIGGEAAVEVKLLGDYESVTLRHMTLDPGGVRNVGYGPHAGGPPLPPLPEVSLVVDGHVEQLTIESSIAGPIRTSEDGHVEQLAIRDSILQSGTEKPALSLGAGEVTLERVTVLGAVRVHRLWATETLITGAASPSASQDAAQVTDVQAGCFRFSAAPSVSRLPRKYESHEIDDWRSVFTSRRFGHPAYAQLSQAAPELLHRGAENGSEIGAWSGLLNPIKFDSLRAKVDELMPFGLIPIFIRET